MSRQPIEILDELINQINPRYVIALFSGGHDSTVATHVASRHPRFSFACHLDTGIGIEKTRDFVRKTCNSWGIELKVYRASEYVRADGKPDPQIYEELVKEYGFPGPAHHTKMYNRLKERPLRMMLRELDRKRSDKVVLVSGIRKYESKRRMRHVVKPLQVWEGTKIWVAPIWELDKVDVGQYMQDHGLQRNEVVDALHKSGECLCGAFAKHGELSEIEFWYPKVAEEIRTLEQEVKKCGFVWGWEKKPPKWWGSKKAGQQFLPGFESIMCASCRLRERME